MTRRVGKSKMYKLNEENPIVRKMVEIDASISENYAARIVQKQIKPIAIKS
jgi:hypothetical protein